MKIDIKRAVVDEQRAWFSYYRDGSLWYVTEYDELFPVPIDDIGNATFNREEKAILLMRYMRKWNESIDSEIELKLPGRAHILHPERKETIFLSWDPIAVRLINHLLQDSHAKLIISSTWAGLGLNEFTYHMSKNGLTPEYLWTETKHWTSHHWGPGTLSRDKEIQGWLKHHKDLVDKWVAFDDDKITGAGAIQVTFDNGIQMEHYLTARKCLDLPKLFLSGE